VDIDFERIGLKIRLLRTQKGFSQEALAERANISRVFISNVECGKKNTSLETVMAIADALSVQVTDIILEGTSAFAKDAENDPLRVLSDCSADELDFLLRLLNLQRATLRSYHITK